VHGLFSEHVGERLSVNSDVLPWLVIELVGEHCKHLVVDFGFHNLYLL